MECKKNNKQILNAQRWSFLAILIILAQDIAQHFRNAVHSQLPANRQSAEQKHRSRFTEQRLEGQGYTGEALRCGHLIKLAGILQGY